MTAKKKGQSPKSGEIVPVSLPVVNCQLLMDVRGDSRLGILTHNQKASPTGTGEEVALAVVIHGDCRHGRGICPHCSRDDVKEMIQAFRTKPRAELVEMLKNLSINSRFVTAPEPLPADPDAAFFPRGRRGIGSERESN